MELTRLVCARTFAPLETRNSAEPRPCSVKIQGEKYTSPPPLWVKEAFMNLENRYLENQYAEDQHSDSRRSQGRHAINRVSDDSSHDQWAVYRTRFLVRAHQLTEPLIFIDPLGREQSGLPGDYLVETSVGVKRITAKALFEDIYVPLGVPLATTGSEVPAVPAQSVSRTVPESRARATA